MEGSMCFYEEVEEIGTHEPLDLGLDIDRINIRQSRGLFSRLAKAKRTRRKEEKYHETNIHHEHVS